jgi:hypothetical protein
MTIGSAVTIACHSSSISRGRSGRSTSCDPQILTSLIPAVASCPSCRSTVPKVTWPWPLADRQRSRRPTSSAADLAGPSGRAWGNAARCQARVRASPRERPHCRSRCSRVGGSGRTGTG